VVVTVADEQTTRLAEKRGQHPREAEILNALYLKVDGDAIERAEDALCTILDERHAALAEVERLTEALREEIRRRYGDAKLYLTEEQLDEKVAAALAGSERATTHE
jgi:hypothetical protein